jgi:hypothetical protein
MKKFSLIILLITFILPVTYAQTKQHEIKEATVTYKRKTTVTKKTTQSTKTQSSSTSTKNSTITGVSNTNKTNVQTTPAANITPSQSAPAAPASSINATHSSSVLPAETPMANSYDTIIKLGGKKIPCSVKKINPTSVLYTKPESQAQLEMLRKEIEKIHYKTGKKEVFNKPVFSVIDQSQWEAVMVTENEADVQGLYQVGAVKANASAGSRSPKAAKQSAIIRLQKKTANMGALIVLVISSESKGGYGEIPGWQLEGIAYSDSPPTDTATVNKAIRQMIARNKARIEAAKNKQ